MSLLTYTSLFHQAADKSFDSSSWIAGNQISHLCYAHGTATDWARALTYPIKHLINATINALKIVMGAGLLLTAFFYHPLESVPQVAIGLGNEICALGLNVLNIALSMISIATRTVASILAYPFLSGATTSELSREDNDLNNSITPSFTM